MMGPLAVSSDPYVRFSVRPFYGALGASHLHLLTYRSSSLDGMLSVWPSYRYTQEFTTKLDLELLRHLVWYPPRYYQSFYLRYVYYWCSCKTIGQYWFQKILTIYNSYSPKDLHLIPDGSETWEKLVEILE